MSTIRTIDDINARIKKGSAVVLDAAEMATLVREKGPKKAAAEVDVVTTGTFSPMCSSGLFFNFGQPQPPVIKGSKVTLNHVPCYGGLAAADSYLGATEPRKDDPLNKVYPGRFVYGGGHVIEDLLRGKSVHLHVKGYGTDCYPRKELDIHITLDDLPYAELVNPRNAYQNYNCAVNLGKRTIYTYMGALKPNMRNCNYATSGEYSPLFNDPYFRTIGMGTRIFLGGGIGYVIGAGTQHNAKPQRNKHGLPLTPSGTIMVTGSLKQMNPRYIRGGSLVGYGTSLIVGIGIPIPILDEEMARFTGVNNSQIEMPIKDYGHDVPSGLNKILKHATFEELASGSVTVDGTDVQTVPLTSYTLSREIAEELKSSIQNGNFLLSTPQDKIESV